VEKQKAACLAEEDVTVRVRVRIIRVFGGHEGSCKKCKKPLDPRVDKRRRCRACRDERIRKIKKYGGYAVAVIAIVVGFVLKRTDDEDTEDDDQLT
jgi:hypothetical protein